MQRQRRHLIDELQLPQVKAVPWQQAMWESFDPEIRQKLALIKHLTVLRRQVPVKEWPLLADGNTLFIVREWPNGEVTAYLATNG